MTRVRAGVIVICLVVVAIAVAGLPAGGVDGRQEQIVSPSAWVATSSRPGVPDSTDPTGRLTTTADVGMTGKDVPYIRKQLLLKFEEDAGRRERADVRDRLGVELIRAIGPGGLELVRLTRGDGVTRVRRRAEARSSVAYAEPNFVYAASARPSDPLFSSMWGLENSGASGVEDADIDAPDAWDTETGSNTAVVAIVDSGVAYNHPDLRSNVWRNPAEEQGEPGVDDDANGFVDDLHGWDWVGDDRSPIDANGHGTHVAGTIGAAGDNDEGITGVSWDASIMALRVLGADGSGSSADVAAAFHYAGQNGAMVVNASLGGAGRSQALMDAIAAWPQTLFVVAAGNAAQNNDLMPAYPCNYSLPNVICVAATGTSDELASFSNYGSKTVHLAAPGTRILSTVPIFNDVLLDDFETPLEDRWASTGSWGRATDAQGSFLSDSPEGSYQDGADAAIMVGGPVGLDVYTECALSFHLRLDTQPPNDALILEGAADGHDWKPLGRWTGSTQGRWISATTDLSTIAGGSAHLRLRLVSDAAVTQNGADVDNLRVRCVAPTFTRTTYAYYSGTSMATPHVAGAAALLWSAAPSATVAEIKVALTAGGDRLPTLASNTISGARLNLVGALQTLAPGTDGSPTSPSPEPSATASNTPSPSPTPGQTAKPEPTPSPIPTAVPRERGDEITLRLRGHLIARGTVTAAEECRSDRKVKILRGNKVIARTRADSEGSYRVRITDRRGSYVAVAAGATCESIRSEPVRHLH